MLFMETTRDLQCGNYCFLNNFDVKIYINNFFYFLNYFYNGISKDLKYINYIKREDVFMSVGPTDLDYFEKLVMQCYQEGVE